MSIDGLTHAPTQLLAGGRVVTPDGVLEDAWVAVSDGRIADVAARRPEFDAPVVDLAGAWLLPGYIDLHMHGGGGHSVASSAEAMAAAVEFHLGHGTTSTLVSSMTGSEEALAEQLRWASELVARGPSPRGHVLGAHLEGPFLSARRCGAQNETYMIDPDPAMMARLAAIAGSTLRMVTIAPELDGATEMIASLAAAGIVVAMGHSDATYEQARAGIAAGARHTTHLFNAMRSLHHREPGLVGAALGAGLSCELINDGRHVHPTVVALIFQLLELPVLITDAIDATGVGDGEYQLGGQEVHVRDGEARLASTGSLAGSTLTMDRALRNAVLESGISIERASAAASGNPARVLGLEARTGSIAVGKAADMVVLDDDLCVAAVMASGGWRTESQALGHN